jgi:hypothetical protein
MTLSRNGGRLPLSCCRWAADQPLTARQIDQRAADLGFTAAASTAVQLSILFSSIEISARRTCLSTGGAAGYWGCSLGN